MSYAIVYTLHVSTGVQENPEDVAYTEVIISRNKCTERHNVSKGIWSVSSISVCVCEQIIS